MFETARAWLARRIAPAAPRAQQRRFDGARVDRLASEWAAETRGINEELRADLDRLRRRCRGLTNNNDYARKFRQMCQANIVGPSGIRLQARAVDMRGGQVIPDRLANQAIEAAWTEWSQRCDLSGRMGLREMLEALVGGLPSDGEFLVRLVRGPESGNRFGLALQPIDVERIDTTYNAGATRTSNAVIMGIEVDSYRRPVAVHLFSAHPNDGVWSSRERIRVPAAELLHVFRAERPEQVRGIPWMAPGVLSLHHLGKFDLAALLAAEHGASLLGFFQTPDGEAPFGEVDESGQQITVSQPGVYDVLPPGVTFAQHDSKYPSDQYGAFHKAHLQRIASGWGVAYHSLANDLENVNFSSIRSGTLEERDRWSADQEWLISSFLRPVFAEWLRMALLLGAITMPNGSALPPAKYEKFARHQWQPRRWDWVDPKSDIEAAILKVRAGLVAPQDVASAMGYDFEDVLQSIKTAQDMAAEFGVRLTAYDATPGAAAAQPQNNGAT
jgi:lambda family phage portal protein